MKKRFFIFYAVFNWILISFAFSIPNFTFVQISDTHAPSEQSRQTISQLKNFGRVNLQPFGTQSYSPAFIINTGDMTEFGEEGWTTYQDYWKGIKTPLYNVLGNHDNTWAPLRDKLRAEHGSPYYSFDTFGCHFMILESATVQDPLPSFCQEQINWIKEDLKKIKTDTPIFLCFHHPLDSTEFVSPYERYRLLELFQSYNLVCILVGHGHVARYHNFEGWDSVEGGCAFGENPGFNLITVSNNTLYVVYYTANDSTAKKALLQKPILKQKEYPNIVISQPTETKIIKENNFEIHAVVNKFPGMVSNALYEIDGGKFESLSNAGTYYKATVSTDDLLNGAHYLRVVFTNSQATAYRTQKFIIEKPGLPIAEWRINLPSSSECSPVLDHGTLYVGGTDGHLYALDAANGKIKWVYTTGAEIISKPAVVNGIIYFGSGDGNFYAVAQDGKLRWQHKADSPIYSSPCVQDGTVYFGSRNGTMYALRADSGVMQWKYNPGESYCIQDQPVVKSGLLYYAAWDSYVYAVEIKTGSLAWRTHNAGSDIRKAAKKYYSAAASSPVITKSLANLFIADRDWYLSAMNLETGILSWYTTNCLAASASEDGDSLYIRTLKGEGQLQKWTLEGNIIWISPIWLNQFDAARALRYTVPPVEKNGKVYAVSCWGTLYCVDSKDGKILWQYQVTPMLAVMSAPVIDDFGTVYVTAMDGTVTAITGLK